jgi:two-component system phosphate regulon sensor histidine kinase PhoR
MAARIMGVSGRAEAQPLIVAAVSIVILIALAVLGRIGAPLAIVLSLGTGLLAAWRARRVWSGARTFGVAEGEAPAFGAESWRNLLEAVQDPTLLLDSGDSVIARNRRAAEMSERVRVGSHISSAIRDPDVLQALQRVRETREPQIVRFSVRVPVVRHYQAILAPVAGIASAAGRLAVAVTFRDLTEQERLNRMRADFIANASHELRTPLTAVLGFVETLQGPARNDEAARERFLAIMAKEASRMKRLIGDLASLTRVEMHEHVRPHGEVDLNELLSGVAETVAPIAEEAGISIALAQLAGPALVVGDEDELVQVFTNLVGNALKYGRSGGRVDIGIESRPPEAGRPARIAVAVADDGIGIPEIHLHRLTERFYRVDTAASRAAGGTGLGLAIVKHILNRHEGELLIRSVEGKGSTFTVLLPAKPRPGTSDPI